MPALFLLLLLPMLNLVFFCSGILIFLFDFLGFDRLLSLFNSKVSAHVSQICLIRVDIVGFFVLLGFIQSAQLLIVYCKKFIYVHRAVLVRRIKHNLLRIFRSCFSLF